MKTTRSDWVIPASLIALALVPALAGTARVAQLAGTPAVTPGNARFVAAPFPIVLHIVAAVTFSLVGAVQFSPGLRRRWRAWHRAAGRVLVACGLVVATSGLWMTVTYPWPAGDGVAVYVERLVAGTAMLASMLLAIDAIRRRDFNSHGDWMTRAYAIGMGAGTQVLTHLPWFIFADLHPAGAPRAIMMGAGWAINILVAEWVIRRPKVHRGTVLARAA